MTKNAYFIGIKGVGMAALAVLFKEAGFAVSGSDSGHYPTEELLDKNNIAYFNEFNNKNLKGLKPTIVVVSAAYNRENAEVKEAFKRKLNVIYYSEALAQISADKKVIAVSGIHGKTTTAALVAFILEKAHFAPSFLFGAANAGNLKTNARYNKGEYFVLEADEYRKSPDNFTPKFLDLSPEIAVISSIELDHPDIFSSLENVYNAFYRFACRVRRGGFIVLCLDYPKAKKLQRSLADRQFETYGFEKGARWQIVDFQNNPKTTSFYLLRDGEKIGPFELEIFGAHNVLNAAAAVIVALKLGIAESAVKRIIKQFSGVGRRFEKIFDQKGILIFDDYAHHPTAVAQTLKMVKEKFPEHYIWAIFQPHTYSRTQALLADFGRAFGDADKVIITDIFASAREQTGAIGGLDLAGEIKKNRSGICYLADFTEIKNYLREKVKAPAVIITMGAGDIYKINKELIKIF